MAHVVGLVLAAGRSERAGSPKALAELDGEPLVARAVRVLRAGGCADVLVVVGEPHAQRVASAVNSAHIVENPDPGRGMLSSLLVGLGAARELRPPADACVFSLVDHPRVAASTVAKLIEAFESGSGAALVPSFDGKPGHPVLVSATLAERLRATPEPATVRDALSACAKLQFVAVQDAGVLDDADTPEALRRLGAKPTE